MSDQMYVFCVHCNTHTAVITQTGAEHLLAVCILCNKTTFYVAQGSLTAPDQYLRFDTDKFFTLMEYENVEGKKVLVEIVDLILNLTTNIDAVIQELPDVLRSRIKTHPQPKTHAVNLVMTASQYIDGWSNLKKALALHIANMNISLVNVAIELRNLQNLADVQSNAFGILAIQTSGMSQNEIAIQVARIAEVNMLWKDLLDWITFYEGSSIHGQRVINMISEHIANREN